MQPWSPRPAGPARGAERQPRAPDGSARAARRARRGVTTGAIWAAIAGTLAGTSGVAHAQADAGATATLGARSVARAGATLVSDDGAAALLLQPAGLARRETPRLSLGVTLLDGDASYRPPGAGAGDAQGAISDRAAPTDAPVVAFAAGVGPIVAGVVALESSDAAHVLPEPERNLDPANQQRREQIRRQFPHRYGGTALAVRRRAIAAGAAFRARDWLGVGASVSVSQLSLSERRTVWAGFDGIDDVGDPVRDLVLELAGATGPVLGGSAGVLLAPPELPLEVALAASVRAGDTVRADDAASLVRATTGEFPAPMLDAPRAKLALPGMVAVRAGARYLGERVTLEIAGEVIVHADARPAWTVTGVAVEDGSGRVDALVQVPSLVDRATHAAGRGAVDVAVVPGFLWLSAGYAYRTRGARREQWVPAHADLGGHTLAVGAEGQWSGVTLIVGYARTLARAVEVTDSEQSIVNPFGAGTAPSGTGRYDQAHDAFGAAVELSWE